MALTAADSLNTNAWEGGLTQVWGPQDYTNQVGWNTHTLTSAFHWDGVSNLVVQTCNNNQNNSDNPIMVLTTTPFTSTIWRLTNNGNICGGGGANLTPTDQAMERPIVQFGLIPMNIPPITNFAPANVTSCSGTVQFQDLSAFDPTAWLWNFGDNTTDTSQNPLHTYAAPGTYDVTLITTNQFGSDTLVVVGAITILPVGPQPVPACIPSTTSILAGFGILNIGFANTSVVSDDGSIENYVDRSCQLDTVTAGSLMNININTGTAAPHNVRVWVDWNNSGTFDGTELVLTANSVTNASASVTVPTTASMNTPIRLRAIADFQVSPFPTPCGNPQFGQAEDYGLVVISNALPPATNFDSDVTVTCTGQVQFNDLSLNAPTLWQWDFGDTNTSNDQNPLHTYTADGTYTVTLITFNGFGSDTLTFTNYVTVDLNSQLNAPVCTPQTQAILGDFGINSVDFVTISSVSPGAIEGYQDRSCLFNTAQLEGVAVPISIGTGIQNSHDVFVWLDLNNDGDLSNSELIWSALDVTNPSGMLTIPIGAVYNTPLRLRITADAQGTITSSCDDPSFGQTEDFGLTVLENTAPPTALFSANMTTVCAGEPIQFTDLSQNLPNMWSWDFGDTNTSTDQNPVHTYLTPGSFNVSLNVSNQSGSDAITQTAFVTVLDSNACDTTLLGNFNTQTVTSCGGVITDINGPNADYNFFSNGIVSIQPTGGTVVVLTFSQFDIRPQDDFIVYDGPDELSPVIGTFNGTALPNGGQIVSSGSALTIELDIGGGGGGGGGFGAGFIANWICFLQSVDDIDGEDITIFPNPTEARLSIATDKGFLGQSTISIINPLGQLVFQERSFLTGTTDLDVSSIAQGTYTLRIENQTKVFTEQLSKSASDTLSWRRAWLRADRRNVCW